MGLEIGDAGGEEPYNPRDEQLVLMLAVMVDGQPAVGADVIKAELVTQNLEGQLLWKFRIRDFAFQPVWQYCFIFSSKWIYTNNNELEHFCCSHEVRMSGCEVIWFC